MTSLQVRHDGYRRWLLFAVLGLTLVRGLIYSVVVPPWQAPDEPRHFEYVRLLDEKRRLVGWEDLDPNLEQEIIASMLRFDYWRFGFTDTRITPPESVPGRFWEIWRKEGTSHMLHQPPLAYLLYLIPLKLTQNSDPATQLFAMRLLSVLLIVFVATVAFWAIDALFPEDDILLTASLAVVVFVPMHTFMSGMVNNDHLAELLVSMAVLLWILIFRTGITYSRLLLLILLIAGGAMTKRTALVMIPASLVGVLVYLWESDWRRRFSGRHLAIAGLSLMAALVIAGMAVLAWGRVAAANTPVVERGVDFLLHYYLFWPSERFPFSVDQPYFSADAMGAYAFYAKLLFQSFWARFGWLNVSMADVWYQALAGITLIPAAGIAVAVYRVARGVTDLEAWQWKTIVFCLVCVLCALLLIVGREIRTEWSPSNLAGWPQGRYLFPVIIPIAVLYAFGWLTLIPRRYHKVWLWLWVLVLVGVDTTALLGYIVPFYYPR